tara:strand:- start:29 stop:514 length:486 start_codon:yes stop_codon:yes gene_type:complete
MYNFIFDSDALIKLAYSGALAKVCEIFECSTTIEVKREVIDEGKKRFYPDAELIEEIVEKDLLKIKEFKKKTETTRRLGCGELSVWQLSKVIKNSVIVSDDQSFLNELEKEKINFLVPVDLIILLKRLKKINLAEANQYLEGIKVFIRIEEYNKAKKEIGG